ncbi:hypothetical protein X777_09982 [Ooceraea biroi]|uniref:Uncharacterized protein n=1 Tax=Ooceraea biroi TaxID=2015173 RepID=A0A026W8F3_OOCBI|nr:hypothetical protein X777_09982 [Ooceraea biroi]
MRVVLKRRPSPRSVGVSSGEGARQLTHRSNPPSQPFDPPHPSTFDQQSNHPRPQPPHHFDSGRRRFPSHIFVSPRERARDRETAIERLSTRGSPPVQARRRQRGGAAARNGAVARRADEVGREQKVRIVGDRARETTRTKEKERRKEKQRG